MVKKRTAKPKVQNIDALVNSAVNLSDDSVEIKVNEKPEGKTVLKSVRIPTELIDQLEEKAFKASTAKNRVSVSSLIVEAIRDSL